MQVQYISNCKLVLYLLAYGLSCFGSAVGFAAMKGAMGRRVATAVQLLEAVRAVAQPRLVVPDVRAGLDPFPCPLCACRASSRDETGDRTHLHWGQPTFNAFEIPKESLPPAPPDVPFASLARRTGLAERGL
jgi:hypothetical protein